PVPTKDKLNIEIPDNIPAGVYATITNLIGVDTGEKYGLKDGKNVIDVSSFSNGIYFLNIYIDIKVTLSNYKLEFQYFNTNIYIQKI
ncbi:T9SS type A sorting domain-containing protein, partial [Acinetobacter baumannii]|uniref:T9SS type A sorting domain-containing protein n=1 Tax=Acinetobacter baumannii TaxID=470 RepID=UPI00312CB2B3